MVPIFIITIFICLSGCSSGSKSESGKMSTGNQKMLDSVKSGAQEKMAVFPGETAKKSQTDTAKLEVPNQMVIYDATLQLRVKKFEQTLQTIEEAVSKYGGYIAESNLSKSGTEQVSGSIKIRIPQKHFQDFLHDAEGQAAEVIQRNIAGQDVTEEYVDLESRIKSKRVVEERLTTFMKTATKTEDLLKISSDLAAIQEDIEIIEGKMTFLENQTALSTVNITLYENKVIVPDIEKDKLNTWEKTKKQFMKSTNLLLAGLSGFVVFIIGNLPILLILLILGLVVYFYYKKRRGQKNQE